MKKKLITQFLLTAIAFYTYAQDQKPPLSDAEVRKYCDTIAANDLRYLRTGGRTKLVSRYTFRNLIKNDFSTVTIADNTATVGQFASLSIDPNTYKLAFSPLAWSPTDDLVDHDFRHVFAINVTATLNNQSLLNLKDWRTATLSFSWTFIMRGTKYLFDGKKQEQMEFLQQPDEKNEYKQIYTAITKQMLDQLHQAYKNKLAALNHPEFLSKTDLEKAYMDSVSKYEQILTKDKWTSKRFIWLKLTGNLFSFDNAFYIDMDNPATFDHPAVANNWTPSANIALNYFIGNKSGWNFYWNANVSYGLKDMFSQIYTPQTYDSFDKLTDISMIQKTNEQIFEITGQPLPSKLLPDFGGELIIIKSFKKIGLGADINYVNNFVVSNQQGVSTGNISTVSLGLVLGLKDKTGKSNINIEPYWQYQDYFKLAVQDQHIWGLKFSIPINSLY